MSLYKMFGTDKNLERDGVWVDYGNGIKILLACAGGANHRYSKTMERVMKPFMRQIQTKTIDGDLLHKLLREVFAEAVILGWEGVVCAEGKPLAFTLENAISLLEDLPKFYEDLKAISEDFQVFKNQVKEDNAKN